MHARSREVLSFNLLDRFWLMLRCPSHEWSWPRTNNEEPFTGFDAHQTCFKCDSTRFFDSRGWQSGPIYRRTLSHYSHLPAAPARYFVDDRCVSGQKFTTTMTHLEGVENGYLVDTRVPAS